MQDKVWFPASFMQRLHFTPTHWADPSPQRFGCCFLGCESNCQGIRPSVALCDLVCSKNPLLEPVAMPVKRYLDARDLDDVNSGFQYHSCLVDDYMCDKPSQEPAIATASLAGCRYLIAEDNTSSGVTA